MSKFTKTPFRGQNQPCRPSFFRTAKFLSRESPPERARFGENRPTASAVKRLFRDSPRLENETRTERISSGIFFADKSFVAFRRVFRAYRTPCAVTEIRASCYAEVLTPMTLSSADRLLFVRLSAFAETAATKTFVAFPFCPRVQYIHSPLSPRSQVLKFYATISVVFLF